MKWVIYSFFIFHTTFAIACILTEVLQCKPILAAFDLSLRFRPDAICNDLTTFYWISSAIHACSDIASLALPMWMVIGMRMSWQKKLAVCFMFGLGGLSCVCSIVRMVYIDKWFHSDEISWDAYHPAIWGQLEGALAIIAASLPALKTLVARVIPGLLSSTNQSKGSSRGIERLKACSRTRDSLSDLFRLNSVVTEQRNATTTTLDTLDKKQTSIITGPIYAPVHRPFSQPPHTNPTLAVATSKERAISYSSYISDSDPLELPPMPRCKPSFGRESDRFDIEQEQRMNDYRYRETVERVERAERAARWK